MRRHDRIDPLLTFGALGGERQRGGGGDDDGGDAGHFELRAGGGQAPTASNERATKSENDERRTVSQQI